MFSKALYINYYLYYVGMGFPGLTRTKQGLMCRAQGLNAVTPVRLKPATPWRQALYH